MNDHELIERITLQLDEGVARLDGATRSRLTQARHRALATRHRRVWIWPAAGGALLATLVGITLWLGHAPSPAPTHSAPLATTDFQLLTDSDSIELYQELDFLEWLEETEGGGVV
ncbi:MAG TPA: DUF3619 family protein [Gammaproteobacteria bacterium]